MMKRNGTWKTTYEFLRRAKLPWGHYILSMIVPFLATIIYVYLPELEGRIATGEIFDKALVRNYLLLYGLLLLFDLVSFYSAWVTIQFSRRVQKLTWRKLILMPMKRFEEEQPSSLITRITDDATYVVELINYLVNVVMTLYSTVLMMAMLFRTGPTLALLTVPVLVLNFAMGFFANVKGYDVGYSIQDAISKYAAFLSERVPQVAKIKAAGTQEEENRRGAQLSDERRKAEFRAQRYEIYIAISMEVTNILLVGFVLMGGAMMVHRGSMGMADLIAFYLLAMGLPNTMQELLFELLKMQQFRGATQVIAGLAQLPEQESWGSKALPPLEEGITFEQVDFSYEPGQKPILQDASFTIPKGVTTAIVGSTGSGKTTILKLLERFYEVDEGQIRYDGTPIVEFDMTSWRRRFGYIIQNSPLLTGTLRSNILYGADKAMTDEEILALADKVQLRDFIDSLPQGLDTPIEGNGTNISGGQRQRIAIARAMAANPDILIMDEATSNLDPVNAGKVATALQEFMAGKTIILVAHQKHTIRRADRVLTVADGKVLESTLK